MLRGPTRSFAVTASSSELLWTASESCQAEETSSMWWSMTYEWHVRYDETGKKVRARAIDLFRSTKSNE